METRVLRFVAPPILITALLWLTSVTPVSWLQGGAAFFLLCIPWWTYLSWKQKKSSQLPFFALVALMFWVYFALPLFWGNRNQPGIYAGILPDSAITQAMVMAVAGVVALWLGMKTGVGKRFALPYVRDVSPDPKRWTYLRVLLVVGGLFQIIPNSQYIAGESLRQVLVTLDTTIPLIVFIFLFRKYLQGKTELIDRYALVLYVCTQLILGLSGGWLGSWLDVVVVAIITYLAERRKVPRAFVLLAIAYAVFFEAGKYQYRNAFWYGGGQQGTVLQRAESWAQISLIQWQAILSDPQSTIGPQILSGIVQRVTLLNQTAHVVNLTPSVVPYQYGNTYVPVVANLVPRFLWPGKPSVNAANQYYQVAYGLTEPTNLSRVSIASGILAEGYMNLGWIGVVSVMFLLGILFGWFDASFLQRDSGALYFAVGVFLVDKFLVIEGQMAQYLGGVVQTLVFVFIVFLPVTYVVRRRIRVTGHTAPATPLQREVASREPNTAVAGPLHVRTP